jgi:glutamate 5-kinase
MHAYETAFDKRELKVAQILLTREDLSSAKRVSNARNTLAQLFKHQIIPVVNENDTVAVEEIKFGDNDNLAALVSHLVRADLLVLLTDTDGLFSEDPRLNPKAKLLPEVFGLDAALEKSATRSQSAVGTGGMTTKIQAARKMMQSGVPMVIANGNKRDVLLKILSCGAVGTLFVPSARKSSKP